MSADETGALREQVVAAAAGGTPLKIVGGGSKAFYGREPTGEPLVTLAHSGIVAYEPKELVVTVRAGTPLADLEAALAGQGQMLPFEPPHFEGGATIGGVVAAGLSGPARPYTGSVRDYVLGVRLLNGRGEVLRFGGEVMKNVAGYDASRLMCGALGTLGVILEVSLKVLPVPECQRTLRRACPQDEAIGLMNAWAGEPWPLTGACYQGATLRVRLAGSTRAVDAACRQLGGDEDRDGDGFWRGLRDHRDPFLNSTATPLWRLAVRSATPPLELGESWIDWGGAQRWVRSDASADEVRGAAAAAGGHAMLFRGGDRRGDVFHPLTATVARFHAALRASFDPQGIFNPGRLYADL